MDINFDLLPRPRLILIGGSAGSFRVVTRILSSLPENGFDIPIALCLHRLKTVRRGFVEALNFTSNLHVVEPDDKDPVRGGKAYLAPANYHLCVELGKTFSLSTEEVVNNSRPAIDLLFETGAYVYRNHTLGIILSGANSDGARGLAAVQGAGGLAIVQDPADAEISAMPEAAMKSTPGCQVMDTTEIIECLTALGRKPMQSLRAPGVSNS